MSDLNTVSSLDQPSLLSEVERQRRAALEQAIEVGLESFYSVGSSLREINSTRLYRDTHPRFEDYVEDRFAISRGQAYNLIRAADASDNLASAGVETPHNEYQLRPLAKLDAGQQRTAWQMAVATANGKRVTHNGVRVAVEELTGKRPTMAFAALPTPPSPSSPPTADDSPQVEGNDPSNESNSEDYWSGSLGENLENLPAFSADLLFISALQNDAAEDAVNEVEQLLTTAARTLKSCHQVLLFCPFADYRAIVAVAEKHGYEFGVPLVLTVGEGRQAISFSFRNETQFVLHFRKGDAALRSPMGNSLAAENDPSVPGFEKPLDLIEALIDAAVPPGSTVLDPSVGAAATVAVCRRIDRHVLGFQPQADLYEESLEWLKTA